MIELKHRSVVRHAHVGSRVTCNPAPTDTDCDILVLVRDMGEFRDNAFEHGYEMDGSNVLDAALPLDGEDRFSSYSKRDVNLIVTEDKEFYRKFIAASSVAKRLNLLQKPDRIALFQAVLYGNPCE